MARSTQCPAIINRKSQVREKGKCLDVVSRQLLRTPAKNTATFVAFDHSSPPYSVLVRVSGFPDCAGVWIDVIVAKPPSCGNRLSNCISAAMLAFPIPINAVISVVEIEFRCAFDCAKTSGSNLLKIGLATLFTLWLERLDCHGHRVGAEIRVEFLASWLPKEPRDEESNTRYSKLRRSEATVGCCS
jgi:hypothetical protein